MKDFHMTFWGYTFLGSTIGLAILWARELLEKRDER